MFEKLFSVARAFEIKYAATIDQNSIKKTIKASMENINAAYPSALEGFVFVSNFKLQNPDSNPSIVSFDLNLDKDKLSIVESNKVKRDHLINSIVKRDLKSAFNKDFDLGFVEVLV